MMTCDGRKRSMHPVAASDFKALASAIQRIYSPTDISQFPSAILSATKAVLPCNTICYNDVNIPAGRMSWITEPADALPSPSLQEMFNQHLHEHPLIACSGSTGSARSLRISDFLSRQQFHRLALYNEYYRPLGIEYQLGTEIVAGRQRLVAIGLDRDRLDFSENERLTLDLLRPHLIQSHQNLQILDLMARQVEGIDRRVVVVDRAGSIRWASDDARHILSHYFDRRRSQEALPDSVRSWTRYAGSRFSEESADRSPPPPLLVRKNTGQITLRFVWGGRDSDHDLIILQEQIETGEGPAPRAPLTKRETEILSWLSQGMTNVEIASALSISPATVKKHLEHIYAKLEVHRRSTALLRSLGV
ncbi:MAG: helix-turn-helix transcriptional regulator [Actinomycetia bacterium]|nr:helix-turn-helix transcriptional regulator [Actinomycetes bacterium]